METEQEVSLSMAGLLLIKALQENIRAPGYYRWPIAVGIQIPANSLLL